MRLWSWLLARVTQEREWDPWPAAGRPEERRLEDPEESVNADER